MVSFFLSSYVVPLTLISMLYIGMLARLWKSGAPGGRVSAESRRGKKRVTRMVVVVVLAFAICWCPIQVILVLKSFEVYEVTHSSIITQIVAHVLAYTNSCINPVLYAFLSDNFRKAFRKHRCPPAVATPLLTRTSRSYIHEPWKMSGCYLSSLRNFSKAPIMLINTGAGHDQW
ncbi:allatostatin receptor [Culex quinquefasciatus]|uniref:Allatostatin receptor n=1 Tax=Culex quinquefasciatus TaxID=7176 RepID=B0X9R4_CULQU|nr:allatostatin receptor [Culex quinquefasciatus]|eukprot:XP_001866386.1 allatostatin receptor [Culex quinquefasciatus]